MDAETEAVHSSFAGDAQGSISKRLAAREALERLYEDWRQRLHGTRKAHLPKMREAQLAFEWIYREMRERLRKSGTYAPLKCVCKLDRMTVRTSSLSLEELRNIPGFRPGRGYPLRRKAPLDFLPYARVDRIGGARSVSEIIVDSEPQAGWLAPYRVTIIPRDSIGLQSDDLSSILELLGDVTIARLEIAFDFPLDSKVDMEFVERFALFGRSRPRHPRAEPLYASFGSRVGAKYVRAYAREFLRIELELHSLDLRRLGITDMFQFHKLADLLPGRYILFARIDHAKLAKWLRRTGIGATERMQIQNVLRKEHNLFSALRYLRREVKLKNTRRLLIPLGINCVVQNALRDWAKHWPKKPFAPGEPG